MAGLNVLNGVKANYAEAAIRLGNWPIDNAQAGIAESAPMYGATIRSIKVEQTPALIVTFASQVSMHANDRSIGLYPSASEDGIHWECRTIDMPTKFLPMECREPDPESR